MLQLFVYQFITLNDSNDMTTTLDNSTKSNIKPDQSNFQNHEILASKEVYKLVKILTILSCHLNHL